MNADERALKDLIGRRSPSQLELVAARDRVLRELRATPGERLTPRIGVTAPSAPRWRTALPLTAAAAIILVLVTIPWTESGGARVYAAGDDGLEVALTDDSRVEMRAHSEMTVEHASDGVQIDLEKGDIIVTAPEERGRQLYVQTKDMRVALSVGSVFLVKAGEGGSRVAVIEGEVSVREADMETRLRPGEQVSTSAVLAARPVRDDIAWSRNADAHRAILESFTKGMAQTAGPLMPLARQADGAGAQTPGTQVAALEFEEASVRACDPDNMPPTPAGARGGGANSFQMTPGRLYALCMAPAVMVRLAYRFRALPEGSLSADTRRPQGWQLNQVSGQGANAGIAVRGGPGWARTERYSIEAVAGADASGDTMSGPMFRALLERRFKLKTHVETEGVPSWTLTVAPGGLKVRPMPPDGCEEFQPVPGEPIRSRTLEEVRNGAKPFCGIGGQPRDNGRVVWIAGGATMTDIMALLRMRGLSGAEVVDKTAVADRFNFVIEADSDDQATVSAVQEQLGLRLEPGRTLREYLVIDSIERPGPN